MFLLCFLVLLISVQSTPVIFDKSVSFSSFTTYIGKEMDKNSKNWDKNLGNPEADIEFLNSYGLNDIMDFNISYVSPRLWEDHTIPYEINPNIIGSHRQQIYNAIDDFHKLTCLRFRERITTDIDYVHFTNSRSGCMARIGRWGVGQPINLASSCANEKATVLHEMMHAIGFDHEHVRPNRDDYITVNFSNIVKGREMWFEKAKKEAPYNEGFQYDLCSLMHYQSRAFSKNGFSTIIPKKKSECFGQRDGFSRIDLMKIRKMYNCHTN